MITPDLRKAYLWVVLAWLLRRDRGRMIIRSDDITTQPRWRHVNGPV